MKKTGMKEYWKIRISIKIKQNRLFLLMTMIDMPICSFNTGLTFKYEENYVWNVKVCNLSFFFLLSCAIWLDV